MANEAATAKDAQFVLISLLPDVCLTPSKSGYPVPYVGSMPFCVELDNLKDTDAPIHQPAAMLVAAD